MSSRRSACGNIRAGSRWSTLCRRRRRGRFNGSSCGHPVSRHARNKPGRRRKSGMTLQAEGLLRVGDSDLEYRMIGPSPDEAPTIVMLHEGLGAAALWGDFPDRLQAATGTGVFVYSRAGYGASSPVTLPRPLDYMHREALDVLPILLDAIGFRRGLLLGHSDGASIAAIYAGGVQDHRIGAVALIAPHFVTEEMGLAAIAETRRAYETTNLREKLARWHRDVDNTFHGWAGA